MENKNKLSLEIQQRIERANAASFAKLVEEAKRVNPNVRDIVWSEINATWYLLYEDGQGDEFKDFGAIILHLNWVRT